MKKIPAKITSLEKSLAFMEGIHAFDEGLSRGNNPYIDGNEELMQAWWNGWDQACGEENSSNGA